MFVPTTVAEEKAKRKPLSYSLVKEIPHEDYVNGDIVYSDGSIGRMYKLSPLFLDALDEDQQDLFGSVMASAVSAAPVGCGMQFLWRKKSSLPILDRHLDIVKYGDPVLQMLARDRVAVFREMCAKDELFSISTEMWIRKKYARSTPGSLSNVTELSADNAIR